MNGTTADELASIEALLAEAEEKLKSFPAEKLKEFEDRSAGIVKRVPQLRTELRLRQSALLTSLGYLALLIDPNDPSITLSQGYAIKIIAANNNQLEFEIGRQRYDSIMIVGVIGRERSNDLISRLFARVDANLSKDIGLLVDGIGTATNHLAGIEKILNDYRAANQKPETPPQ